MVEPIHRDDVIELTVPIYDFEDFINSKFRDGQFLAEYQSLEIKEFAYNEAEGTFQFTLLVKTKEIN